MADRYWVGGTGNWDAATTTNWSSSSGGSGGASVPTSSDNVYFNSASSAGSYTVTITATANCLNFTTAAPATGTMTLAGASQTLNVYGSLSTHSTLNRTYTGGITFAATTAGNTITTNGVILVGFPGVVNFNGTGSWTLVDALSLGTSGTIGQISLTRGTLTAGNNNITCGNMDFPGSAPFSLILGAMTFSTRRSTIVSTITNTLTITPGTSTWLVTGSDGTDQCLILDSTTSALNFYNLTINCSTSSYYSYSSIPSTASITVANTLTIAGNNASTLRTYVRPFAKGTATTITCNGSVVLSNVDLEDITAAGTSIPWSGTSVGDCGGNTNITATSPVSRYWVGGTGSLRGTARWSTSSGGSGGASMPLPQDTCIFDANSFSAPGQTVDINQSRGNPLRFGTLDFSAATNNPGIISSTNSCGIAIYGDLTLKSGMTWTAPTFNGLYIWCTKRSGTQTMNFADVALSLAGGSFIVHSVNGTASLASNLTLNTATSVGTVVILSGTFTTNDYNVRASAFLSAATAFLGSFTYTASTRTINLGSSTFTLGYNTSINIFIDTTNATNITLNAGTSNMLYYSTAVGTASVSIATTTIFNTITVSGTPNFNASNAGIYCNNLVFSGYTGTWTTGGGGATNLYNSLTLNSGMSMTRTNNINFLGTAGPYSITSAGIVLTSPLRFSGTGTWQLLDDTTCSNTTGVVLSAGTFDLNDKNLTTTVMNLSGASTARTFIMRSGTVTLTSTGAVWSASTAGLTVVPGSSTIKINDASATAKTFGGGSLTYNNIWLTGSGTGAFQFTGSNRFNDFKCDTPPHTIQFTAATVTRVRTFTVNGTVGNLMTIGSITAASHTLICEGPQPINCVYLSISRSSAFSRTSTWYAGPTSTDGGNNVGWIFTTQAPRRYCVLGQAAPTTALETTLYTVPEGMSALISSIVVCNRGLPISSFRVSVEYLSSTTANKDYLYYDLPIDGHDTFVATLGLSIPTGAIVRAYAENDQLSFTLFGSEDLNRGSRGSFDFNGSTGFALVTNRSDFAPGTGDFTVEWWHQMDAAGTTPRAFSIGVSPTAALAVFNSSNTINASMMGTTRNLGSYTTTNLVGVWRHIAIVRNSGVMKAYVDGVSISGAGVADTTNVTYSGAQYFAIGAQTSDGLVPTATAMCLDGRITNFHFVVGTALYTANFTPSKAPPNIVTNSKLLLLAESTGRLTHDATGLSTVVTKGGTTWNSSYPT